VQTLEDKQVTVRDRDTMLQERISVDRLKEYLINKLT
jgi:glycyl-tRNA synthetase